MTSVLLNCPKCKAEKQIKYIVQEEHNLIKEIVMKCRSCGELSGVADIISYYKTTKYSENKTEQISSEQLKLF